MMSRKLARVFLCALTVFASLTAAQESSTPKPYEVAEAYRVYNALLPLEQAFVMSEGKVLIRQLTMGTPPPSAGACLTDAVARRFREAIADYHRTNQHRWILQWNFEIGKDYELLSDSSVRALSEKNADRQGAGAFITLSAVGFNAKQTQALVYASNSCSGLCGSFAFHFFEKIDSKWREVPSWSCAGAS